MLIHEIETDISNGQKVLSGHYGSLVPWIVSSICGKQAINSLVSHWYTLDEIARDVPIDIAKLSLLQKQWNGEVFYIAN